MFGIFSVACLLYIFYRLKSASDKVLAYWKTSTEVDGTPKEPAPPAYDDSILRIVMMPFYINIHPNKIFQRLNVAKAPSKAKSFHM